MSLKKGDRIFFHKNGEFFIDKVRDMVTIDGKTVYELKDNDWWCVTEDEIVDESNDERVRDIICTEKDAMVKLSDVRSWLNYNAYNYYEADCWSFFDYERMIKDLCKYMLYGKE